MKAFANILSNLIFPAIDKIFDKKFHVTSLIIYSWISSLSFADFTESLRLTEVRIPNHVIRNNSVRLECHFDLNGEALYSVKWYKDGYEFYRYVPRDHPPAQVFDQNGVNVDVSDFISVTLKFSLKSFNGFKLLFALHSCIIQQTLRSFWTLSACHQLAAIVVKFPPKLHLFKPSLIMVIWLLWVSLKEKNKRKEIKNNKKVYDLLPLNQPNQTSSFRVTIKLSTASVNLKTWK